MPPMTARGERLPDDVAALAAAARKAGERLEAAGVEHARSLALLARAASTGGLGGQGCLEVFAQSAAVSRQTLQEFVTLTTRWEPERVVSLLGMHDRKGRPVTRLLLLRIARGERATRNAFDAAVASASGDFPPEMRAGRVAALSL